MGSVAMSEGVPSPFYLQKMYWAVIGAGIGCATIVNLYNEFLYRQRISVASRHDRTPARPKALLPTAMATTYALAREIAYVSCSLTIPRLARRWTSPALGRVLIVMAELLLVLVLCFYKLNARDQWQWEDIGYRTGFIAAAQLPLVVLLSGKRNLIGYLTGTSYERLNWLHRWVSRVLFLTVTIHMGFWFVGWARYDYIKVKLTTDPITQRGFAAWCILLWIVLSSSLPARRWNYEFFLVQHIVTAIGFFAAVFLHLPTEVKAWIWLPIALLVCDRMVRALNTLRINVSCLNPRTRELGNMCSIATFEPLAGDTTRITILEPPMDWTPGQHVFLTCHTLAPFQAHPFTIASIPSDKRLEFLVKSKSGSTKRFLRHAEQSLSLSASSNDLRHSHSKSIILEGPYGRIRPLRQFDSVFLIAGSSGATFTVPLMRDIVSCWKELATNRVKPALCHSSASVWSRSAYASDWAATRYIRSVWVIKSRTQYEWFRSSLATVENDVRSLNDQGYSFNVEMSIYITCDHDLKIQSAVKGQQKTPGYAHREVKPTTVGQGPLEENQGWEKGAVPIKSSSSALRSHLNTVTGCGLDGTCCCRETVEHEEVALGSNQQRRCSCNCDIDEIKFVPQTASLSKLSASSIDASSQTCFREKNVGPPFDSKIAQLSGRPQPRNLIRKTLEQALGESAVVVCGPQGLVDDVRQSVVALSDERAVHKGSGAQGIYLHAESFEY
ncbi:MAG: hypothetical protein Q9207_000764 [Kuettlingeria erythrocarpa]